MPPEAVGRAQEERSHLGETRVRKGPPILATLLPYLSMPEVFVGARVLHWVDNTSSLAGVAKGYSGVPDSARLVHALHASLAGMRCAVWFEYVRSAANISDEPSRLDLSRVVWDGGLPGTGLVSQPVPVVMPAMRRWWDAAASWTEPLWMRRLHG